ncbi:hypothetical protein F511_10372 [Dorcoceras hygrometricum]|uniref:Uncharacterized protein n=1 Tax=Dorcoceras hygrometricum TaxID=472368 RepID=A0A2Z7CEF0_9LAMI|nr:hypothetical protein F511_10372 [Dorcoceras hygrometricum]
MLDVIVGMTAIMKIPEPLRVTQVLDSRFPHGYSAQCVEHEKRILGVRLPKRSTECIERRPSSPHKPAAVAAQVRRRRRRHVPLENRFRPILTRRIRPCRSFSLLVQADWREIDSGRGPDWRYLPQSTVKCRFLCEIGRSQARVASKHAGQIVADQKRAGLEQKRAGQISCEMKKRAKADQKRAGSEQTLKHKGGLGVLLQQALRRPHRQSGCTHRQGHHLHHLNLVSLEAQHALS